MLHRYVQLSTQLSISLRLTWMCWTGTEACTLKPHQTSLRIWEQDAERHEAYLRIPYGFLGTSFGKVKTSWISIIKSSRKAQSVQCFLVKILHFVKEKRGNAHYQNGFIYNLHQPLRSLHFSSVFRVTSTDATYSLVWGIGEQRSDGQILSWKQFCFCLFWFVFWILLGVCLGQIISFLCAFVFMSMNWQQQ